MLFRLYVRIASWSSGRRDNRSVSRFWRRRHHSEVDLRRANYSRVALIKSTCSGRLGGAAA